MKTYAGEPVCFNCARFICEFDNWHCKAFPVEIPDEVRHGKNDHKSPIEGDNGIIFEKGQPVFK